jgi:hypothetical protein
MNKNIKILIGSAVVIGLAYLGYNYYVKNYATTEKVGGDDKSDLVYEKANRTIEIKKV